MIISNYSFCYFFIYLYKIFLPKLLTKEDILYLLNKISKIFFVIFLLYSTSNNYNIFNRIRYIIKKLAYFLYFFTILFIFYFFLEVFYKILKSYFYSLIKYYFNNFITIIFTIKTTPNTPT